jgi:hypothetical protein
MTSAQEDQFIRLRRGKESEHGNEFPGFVKGEEFL